MEFDDQIKEENQDEINKELLKKSLMLIPYPQSLDFLSKPENTMFTNLFHVIKLNSKHIDINKLKESLITALDNHKGLLCTFKKDDNATELFNNGIFLNYDPENKITIDAIEIKDNINKVELETLFQTHLKIFTHFNSSQINIKLFYNATTIYLFTDICHTVFDGASMGIFFNSINNAYLNKKLPNDYFLYYLNHYNKDIKESEKYQDDVTYFTENFRHDKNMNPAFSLNLPYTKNNMFVQSLTWENFRSNLSKYFSIPNSNKITDYNIFLVMNVLLTHYLFCRCEESHHEVDFTFSGRNWKKEKYSVGCLSTNYPIYYDFGVKGSLTLKDFYDAMKKQLELKNHIPRYPFFHSDKGRTPVIIQREEQFIDINNFCGDPEAEIVYDYSQHFNDRCTEFWCPLSVVLTIGETTANYTIMADLNKYSVDDLNRYIDLMKKSGIFIFDTMDKINTNETIAIPIEY